MGAIFGLIGDGSENTVQSMGERMGHRGNYQRTWQPAPGVFFGERSFDAHISENDFVALDETIYRPAFDPTEHQQKREAIHDIYLADGVTRLHEIRGQFAIALWNAKKQSLLLAVDHFGFKSLFYCILRDRIAFSSEYKSFFALPDFDPDLDLMAAQHHQATRAALIGRPLLAGIKSVPAGSGVEIRNFQPRIHTYWIPSASQHKQSLETSSTKLRVAVKNVVREQLKGIGRAGIALSGGIDSAIVAASAQDASTHRHLTAYSVGYDESDPEIYGANQVARQLHIDHQVTIVQPHQIQTYLPQLIWLMEDCSEREEAVLQLHLAEFVSGKESLMLFGYAADRMLGGMPRHRLIRLTEKLPFLRQPLSELFQMTQTGRTPNSLAARILAKAIYKGKEFPPPIFSGNNEVREVKQLASLNEYLAENVNRMTSLSYIEPESEKYGFVVRSPFLEPDIADLSLSMPSEHKVSWFEQKVALRRAFEGLLPPTVMHRPKAIQRMQHNSRLSDTLDEMVEKVSNLEYIRARQIISEKYLDRVCQRRANEPYGTDQLYRLWTLVSLEIWLRQFADGGGKFWAFDE